MKDLISLHDLTSEEVKGLLELGLKLKKEQKSGIEHHISNDTLVLVDDFVNIIPSVLPFKI